LKKNGQFGANRMVVSVMLNGMVDRDAV